MINNIEMLIFHHACLSIDLQVNLHRFPSNSRMAYYCPKLRLRISLYEIVFIISYRDMLPISQPRYEVSYPFLHRLCSSERSRYFKQYTPASKRYINAVEHRLYRYLYDSETVYPYCILNSHTQPGVSTVSRLN